LVLARVILDPDHPVYYPSNTTKVVNGHKHHLLLSSRSLFPSAG